MSIGRISEISRYPVKSVNGESLNDCEVAATGIWGDRGWALRDEAKHECHGAKRWPILLKCSARYQQSPTATEIPQVDITLPDGSSLRSNADQKSVV